MSQSAGKNEQKWRCLRRRKEPQRFRDVSSFCCAFFEGVTFCSLQDRKRREWGDKVHLTFGDMRVVDIPAKADILVTELLGSLGDNELSPECLDGAVRFLKGKQYDHARFLDRSL